MPNMIYHAYMVHILKNFQEDKDLNIKYLKRNNKLSRRKYRRLRLQQWSPTFVASGAGFAEDNFSTN